MDQGTCLENEDMQSCHSCMRHSVLTCSIILPSIVKIFLMVAQLCSGNELLTPARPRPPPPPAHRHSSFYNQIFPSESLVNKLILQSGNLSKLPSLTANSDHPDQTAPKKEQSDLYGYRLRSRIFVSLFKVRTVTSSILPIICDSSDISNVIIEENELWVKGWN